MLGIGVLIAGAVQADDTPPLAIHFFDEASVKAESVEVASAETPDALPFQMVVYTSEPEPVQKAEPIAVDRSGIEMQFSAGYLQSDMAWNVAAPGGLPNPLLDSKWDSLDMLNLKAHLMADIPYGLALKMAGSYAWELDGTAQQTTYMGDNRTFPFASLNGDSDDSYQWALSFGVGYPLELGVPFQSPYWLRVTPLGGYAWNRQKYTLQNGKQSIDLPKGAAVDNADYNEELRYKAEWDGPWLGSDVTFGLAAQHQIFSTFEHHWVDYSAEGRSENSASLVDGRYQHQTDATAINASVGYRFISDDLWGVTLSADYQKLDGEPGKETLYTSSGERYESRLNDIEFESFGVNLGVNINF